MLTMASCTALIVHLRLLLVLAVLSVVTGVDPVPNPANFETIGHKDTDNVSDVGNLM